MILDENNCVASPSLPTRWDSLYTVRVYTLRLKDRQMGAWLEQTCEVKYMGPASTCKGLKG